jgi:hypothetical protein
MGDRNKYVITVTLCICSIDLLYVNGVCPIGDISHLLREMVMPIIENHSVTVSWKTAIRVFSATSDY